MNLLGLKKKMFKLKARAYASLILGLCYAAVTYLFLEPIYTHLTYQKYILAALICFAAWNSERWAQYKIYKQTNERKMNAKNN
jgi:hypothetical protein